MPLDGTGCLFLFVFPAGVDPLLEQLVQAGGGKAADGAVEDILWGKDPAAGGYGDHHAQHSHHRGNDLVVYVLYPVLEDVAHQKAQAKGYGVDLGIQNFHN